MQAALKLKATVLPGNRVEFTARELTEGEEVELIVLKPETSAPPASTQFNSAWEYLQSLKPIQRTPEEEDQGVWDYVRSLEPVQRTQEEWAEIEREFQEERDSWDR